MEIIIRCEAAAHSFRLGWILNETAPVVIRLYRLCRRNVSYDVIKN